MQIGGQYGISPKASSNRWSNANERAYQPGQPLANVCLWHAVTHLWPMVRCCNRFALFGVGVQSGQAHCHPCSAAACFPGRVGR